MSELIENSKLKIEIEDAVVCVLNCSELFIRVYGKGFASEKLEKNFKKLYTERKHPLCRGCFRQSLSIELFIKGKDGELLTLDDLIVDRQLCVALHECIHAIFNRTKKECKKIGCKSGTGIRESYKNKTELGRGLNEGFTNWICKKVGFPDTSYKTYTKLVDLLEVAIGEENVMRFGYGNIKENISKLLNMNVNECQTFLSKIDDIYNLDRLIRRVEKLQKCLEDKLVVEQNKRNDPLFKIPADVKENLEYLNSQKMYTEINNNKDYITFAKERGLNIDDDETKLEYYVFCNNKRFRSKKENIEEVVVGLYDKYFKKEIEDLVNEPRITLEQLTRMYKIKGVIGNVENENIKSFYQNCKKIEEKEMERACQIILEHFEKGIIVPDEIDDEMEKVKLGPDKIKEDLLSKISKIMMPETPQIYENFLKRIIKDGNLSGAVNYKIFELQNQNGEKDYLYFSQNDKRFLQNGDYVDGDAIYNPNRKELSTRNAEIKVNKRNSFKYTITEIENNKSEEKKSYLKKIFFDPLKRVVSFLKRNFLDLKQERIEGCTQTEEKTVNYTIVEANNFDSRVRVETENLITASKNVSTQRDKASTPSVITEYEELECK